MHDSAQALRGKKAPFLVGFTSVLDVLRGRQPHLPALPRRTGRGGARLRFCGLCRQRHRPAHRGRGSRGPARRSACAGRAGPSPLLRTVRCAGLSVHRSSCLAIPRTASTRLNAGTLVGGAHRDSSSTPSCSLLRRTAGNPSSPKKADPAAGPHPLPPQPCWCSLWCCSRAASAPPRSPARLRHACRRGLRCRLPRAQGCMDGYQTMDALAALNFRSRHRPEYTGRGHHGRTVRRGTIRAGSSQAGCCWWSTPC